MYKINFNVFPSSLLLKTQLQRNGFQVIFLNIHYLYISVCLSKLESGNQRICGSMAPSALPSFLWVNFLCRLPSCAKTTAFFLKVVVPRLQLASFTNHVQAAFSCLYSYHDKLHSVSCHCLL